MRTYIATMNVSHVNNEIAYWVKLYTWIVIKISPSNSLNVHHALFKHILLYSHHFI